MLDATNSRTATLMSLRANPVTMLTVEDGDDEALELALAVAHVLGLEILVQGVRDAHAPRPAGVTAVQGDAVSPEMTAAELTAWLAAPVPA